MASIDITIRAMSLPDLENTIADLYRRFQHPQVSEGAGALGAVPGLPEGEGGQGTAAPRAARRGRKAAGDMAPAARAEAAGEVSPEEVDTAAGLTEQGGAGDAGGGAGDEGGAVRPEDADSGAVVASEEAEGLEPGAAEDTQAPVEEATLEQVRAAAQGLASAKNVEAVQTVLSHFGVAKFNLIPASARADVITAMNLRKGDDEGAYRAFVSAAKTKAAG